VPAGHASVKLAVVRVAGFIALLKAALIIVVLVGTFRALGRGATAVTVGASAGMPPLPPLLPLFPPPPPPPPPHPAAKALSSNTINHFSDLVILANLFICFTSFNLIQKNIGAIERPLMAINPGVPTIICAFYMLRVYDEPRFGVLPIHIWIT
jgi:hypothetical protein